MLRSLRAALIGLVVAPALVVSALPASAGPPTPPPVVTQSISPGDPGVIKAPKKDPKGAKKYTWNISKAQWDAANRAHKATDPAHVNSAGQFDYRWVKKKFKGHPTQLSQFAIGLWYRRQDWGQFTHISAADKRTIIKYGKDHSGPNPRRVTEGSAVSNIALRTFVQAGDDGVLDKSEKRQVQKKAPNECKGRTVIANNKEDKLFWVYYNSCDTANIIDVMDGSVYVLGTIAGIVAVITGGAAALVPTVGAGFMWLNKKYMENRRDASDLKAVIIRFSYNVKKSKYGRYYAPMRIFPQ